MCRVRHGFDDTVAVLGGGPARRGGGGGGGPLAGNQDRSPRIGIGQGCVCGELRRGGGRHRVRGLRLALLAVGGGHEGVAAWSGGRARSSRLTRPLLTLCASAVSLLRLGALAPRVASPTDDRSLLCNACGISIKRRTRRLRAAVAAAATAAPPAAAFTVGGGCASVPGPGQGPSVGSPPADGTTHGDPAPPRGWPNADAMSGVTTSSRRSAAAAGSRVGVTSPSHSGRGWGTAWATTSPEPPKAAFTSPRTGGGGGAGGSGGGVGSPITISNLLADDTTCYYTELGSAVAMLPLTLGGRPWHPPALPSTPASGVPPPPRPMPAAAAIATATAATAVTAAAAAVTTAAAVPALPAAPLPPLPPLRGCGTDLPPLGRPPHRRPSSGRGGDRDAWSPP